MTTPDTTPHNEHPDTPQGRLAAAAERRQQEIDAAERTYWSAVQAEIDASSQVEVAALMGRSREHLRKHLKRWVADDPGHSKS